MTTNKACELADALEAWAFNVRLECMHPDAGDKIECAIGGAILDLRDLARILTALRSPSDREAVLEEAEGKGRDDGATFVLEKLGEALGVDDWTICDGTEEWEGDVAATLWSILRKADVIDDEDNSVARHAAIRALSTPTNPDQSGEEG